MRLIWNAVKLAFADFWEEMLYLLIFNIIWLLGSLFIAPAPFLTFGLFFTAYDVSREKGIKFSTFWQHIIKTWRPALGWGLANAAAVFMVWSNIRFYARFEGQWVTGAQFAFVGLGVLWAVLQLVALPVYPRLETPGLKLALRNSLVVLGRRPLIGLALAVLTAFIGAIATVIPAVVITGAVALVVMLANRLVGAVVEQELRRQV
jgi:hypothetical protein